MQWHIVNARVSHRCAEWTPAKRAQAIPGRLGDMATATFSEVFAKAHPMVTLNPVMARYIVDDVDAAIAFYTQHLGFQVSAQNGPHFAILTLESFQLVLSPPQGPGGGSQPMPDGRRPEPGGWNRIIVQTKTLDADVQVLKKAGVAFRNDIVSGPGGRQILLEDPSGNPVELFEAAADAKS